MLTALLLVMAQPVPPTRADAPLTIDFTLSPLLDKPGAAPTLAVTMTNASGRDLDVMRFESDACFAHFLLALTLTLPDRSTPQPAGCAIRSFPGAKGTLAAGAHEVRTLSLAALFPSVKWSAGRYELEADWNPGELSTMFGGAYAHRARQQSANATAFRLAKPVGTLRVKRGQTVTFPDGARLTFSAHGHKRTMTGGPPSPLIIHGAFAAPGGKKLEELDVSVQVEESRVFRIDDYALTLGDYEYDGWMQLTAWGAQPED